MAEQVCWGDTDVNLISLNGALLHYGNTQSNVNHFVLAQKLRACQKVGSNAHTGVGGRVL